MSLHHARLAALRLEIPEIEPRAAHALGAILIDIREPHELESGSPAGAIHIGRDHLEERIGEVACDASATVLLVCATGVRTLYAADGLRRMGYGDVRSVLGGVERWRAEGLPVAVSRVLDGAARARYARHLLMPQVGEAGQRRLLDARVLLVGVGGLGSPVAMYLAAAGVGTIGLVDDDVVERSNLQRQIAHTDGRIGQLKVDSARQAMLALNPSIEVVAHPVRLHAKNVEALFGEYEVVVDGTDNFTTRYLVNDACVRLGRPNVHGAVYRFEGQVSVYAPSLGGPCYRCLYPAPPPPELAPSCAQAGVLGVVPGVVGLLQAAEVIKLVLGLGEPLVGIALQYDALAARFSRLGVPRDPGCPTCGADATFTGYTDYDVGCAAP